MIALRRSLVASLLVTASAFAADPEVNAAPAADAPAAKPAESVSKPAEPVAAAATDGTYEKPTRGEQRQRRNRQWWRRRCGEAHGGGALLQPRRHRRRRRRTCRWRLAS